MVYLRLIWQDYFTRGRSQPLPDASQDYKLLNASEVGGYTELMFERPRDTKDDEDLLFLVSSRAVIYIKQLAVPFWIVGQESY